MSTKHLNTTAGSPPYKGLFSTVSIVPPNTSVAYVSTQWAADPATGELAEGVADDYAKQATIIYQNLIGILKELGAEMKDVIHKTVTFNDEIGMAVIQAQISVTPDEWKPHALSASLTFNQVEKFHRPGIVLAVDILVAVLSK